MRYPVCNCSDCGYTDNGCPDDENDYDELYHADLIYDEQKNNTEEKSNE